MRYRPAWWATLVGAACGGEPALDRTGGGGDSATSVGGASDDVPADGGAPSVNAGGGGEEGGSTQGGEGGARTTGGEAGSDAGDPRAGAAGAAGATSFQPPLGPAYYVSNDGDDAADGRTPESAWRTLEKVATTLFAPDDTVLLRRGHEWRERLVASSSGVEGAPITYGAYGDGPPPELWGSDDLDPTDFQESSLGPGIYELTPPVDCLLEDHEFLRFTWLILDKNNDVATNFSKLQEVSGSWYSDDVKTYVHLDEDPRVSGRLYSRCNREDLIWSNAQSHLVFRDLALYETAKIDSGYAARIERSTDVRLENIAAYRAGKHHFGLINSTDFVGVGLLATGFQPDQGNGKATAFVAYASGEPFSTSRWIDCTAYAGDQQYPAFIMHGSGIADVLVENLTAYGYGPVLYTEHPDTVARVEGGVVHDGLVVVSGDNITLDGLRVTGELSAVMVEGGSNTLQNMVIDGQRSDWWSGRAGSIIDGGVGTRILFNTIVPMPTGRGSAIALRAGASATQIFGNILASTDAALRFQFDEMPVLDSNYNLMEAETPVVRGKASDVLVSRESWVDFGQDHASIFTTPVFAEGEYRLCAGALGTAMTGLSPVTLSVELDAMGDVRSSDAPDIGALLAAPECPSFPN